MRHISFKTFLYESFNEPYPHKAVPVGEHSYATHKYHFNTDHGNHYRVSFAPKKSPKGEKHAEVSFHQTDKKGDSPKERITGSEKHSAMKVFGTVHHIIHQHAKTHEITHLHFAAHPSEPSRGKLYHTMARKISPDYKHNKKTGDFVVPLK